MPVAFRGLHEALRPAAEWTLAVADYYEVPVTVTSVFRSWEDQTRLRRNYEACLASGEFGKTAQCRYPANRPGDSAHNWGLAWDSTVPERYQSWWDAVRRYAGFEVLENDRIHAQLPSWRSYVDRRSPGPL